MMKSVIFLLFVTLCAGNIGNFKWETRRIQRHIPFLVDQVRNFRPGRDTYTPRAIAAIRKYHPEFPPNLKQVPPQIQADNIPFPELKSELREGENPLYFPQRGQEFDVLGRPNPVYIPFKTPQFPGGITFFPFDRKTLRLAAPEFKVAIPTGLGPSTGIQLPLYPALQDDNFRLVRAPHISIADPQQPTDPKFPIIRHFELVE